MWFDMKAALFEIEHRTPATLATPATQEANSVKIRPRVADVADVAAPQPSKQKSAGP